MIRKLGLAAIMWLVGITGAMAANCSSYPYTFVNGQVIQAPQFNANFASILSCANANLAHSGANSDITSLIGLTTPLGTPYGGTGLATGGTVGQTLVSNGSSVAYGTPVVPAHLNGLVISNNVSDATNDIDIAVGTATDSTNVYSMTLGSALTKRLDATWTVGTNQGCFDTGAIANTTYHIWLIARSDTGVKDVLCSASASSPTMPTSYDYKRRIGSILRESAAIVPFIQNGNIFIRSTQSLDVNASSSGTSAVTRTLKVPIGIVVNAIVGINHLASASGISDGLYISSLTQTDNAATGASLTSFVDTNGRAQWMQFRVDTNTSAQIRSRESLGSSNITLAIYTQGWVDTRGQ